MTKDNHCSVYSAVPPVCTTYLEKMEVYLYSGRRSVSAVPPVRKRKMENTEHRSVSAVPPVCTRKIDTEHRSVSAVPPVWTRKMEVDSVLRFLHHRRVSAGQVGGSLKKSLLRNT